MPGSHKSNVPLPGDWRNLERLPAEVEGPPHADAWRATVRAVTGRAGSVILFTEALTHGTLPWRGADERRTVFFKYCPHPLAWSSGRYDLDEFDDLTEVQRHVLGPPNVPQRRGFKY